MTSYLALIIANMWFVNVVKSRGWKIALGCFWVLIALTEIRL